ncbi:MAG: type I-U CRISPR-associated protein Csx17 [Candidatus Hinthialibacter antarcticus]|nr:type I-U CRISPR-associated protein Csx17 [Candidatus Hinthialibacter antarcticus]
MNTQTIQLRGCTPEPLMSYLKALGILRLVSEQIDPDAVGCWRNDVFVLQTELTQDQLVEFFLNDYQPTPIVVPWSGNDYFEVNQNPADTHYRKTPSGPKIVEAFNQTKCDRLKKYREAISKVFSAMQLSKIHSKADMGKNKPKYLSTLRNISNGSLVEWIDASSVIIDNKSAFNDLLGSGGGSDGNTHLSDNFMQNLWDMFPDFDEQRQERRNAVSKVYDSSKKYLSNALFSNAIDELILHRTSALYDSSAIGGPNSTQGMDGDSLMNPWNFILLLEGTICFAGALVKRFNTKKAKSIAFPFRFDFTTTDNDRTSDKERSGHEFWMPLWSQFTSWCEISYLLKEGRAEIGQNAARNGLDMARSVVSLSVDRGVNSYNRFAIVKGRVGGDNYNTAVNLGKFHVHYRKNISLITQIDRWLSTLRSVSSGKNVPVRYATALRKIETTIFDYCRFGGNERLIKLLICLGAAQQQLGVTMGKVGQSLKTVSPLSGLSGGWLDVLNPQSTETRLALSIAGIWDASKELGSIRTNMEHVELTGFWKWSDVKHPRVVWSSSRLTQNLAAVLARRMMDGNKKSCDALPIHSRFPAGLNMISAFLANETDDEQIDDLLWGFIGIDFRQAKPLPPCDAEAPPLPRAYALLKLLFLPGDIVFDTTSKQWRFAKDNKPGVAIRPEPRILPLLRAGRLGEACRIAYGRLVSSGFQPLPGPDATRRWREHEWDSEFQAYENPMLAERIAAALILPIHDYELNILINLVTRKSEPALS